MAGTASVRRDYIESKSVVPLLISSEFLGFQAVVEDAIAFIVQNFNEIVQL